MTKTGHIACAAAIAFAVVAVNPGQAGLLLAVGILAGSNAPDWSERIFRVQHRTWTHWPVWWLGLVAAGLLAWPWSLTGAAVAGFGAGGLLHLGLDVGTHTGIPIRWPPDGRRRYSLHWYQTGDMKEGAIFLAVAVGSIGTAGIVRMIIARL